MEETSSSYSDTSVGKQSTKANFPVKLHFLLSEIVKEEGLDHIACWQPHGRSFAIRDPKLFETRLLSCYFQQTKFASFQRQLNLYGFRRITSGKDKGAYYHENFVLGQEDLARTILRTKVKGKGGRKRGEPQKEPNFYSMSPLPDVCGSRQEPTTFPVMQQILHSSDNLVSMDMKPIPLQSIDRSCFASGSETFTQNLPENSLSLLSWQALLVANNDRVRNCIWNATNHPSFHIPSRLSSRTAYLNRASLEAKLRAVYDLQI